MEKYRAHLFLLLLTTFSSFNLFCQLLYPIPAGSYWNTAPDYHFDYSTKSGPTTRVLYTFYYEDSAARERHFGKLYADLSKKITAYYSNESEGGFIIAPDTNVRLLASRAAMRMRAYSVITKDFDDGSNRNYSAMLAQLYTASLIEGSIEGEQSLRLAKEAFDRIPPQSPLKGIAYIQLKWIDPATTRGIGSQGSHQREFLLRKLAQVADTASRMGWFSATLEYVRFSECLGDFWGSYGFIGNAASAYAMALKDAKAMEGDSAHAFLLAKLNEKVYNLYVKDPTRSTSFLRVLEPAFDIDNPVIQLGYHNSILYQKVRGSEFWKTHLLEQLSRAMDGQDVPVLKEDLVAIMGSLRDNMIKLGDYDLARKTGILMLNYIEENDLARYDNSIVLKKLMHTCAIIHDYKGAMSIVTAMRSVARDTLDYYSSIANLEEALIWLEKGNIDSVAHYATRTEGHYESWRNYSRYEEVMAWQNEINREIGKRNGDVSLLERALKGQDRLFSDGSDELLQLSSMFADWQKEHEKNELAKFYEDSISHEQDLRVRDDSLLVQQRRLFVAESLRHEADIRSRKLAEQNRNIKNTAIIIAIIVAAFIAFFFLRLSAQQRMRLAKAKYEEERRELEKQAVDSELRQNRTELQKAQLQSEKLRLEAESFQMGYLGHILGGGFQYLANKLDLARLDTSYIKPALKLGKGLSRIFFDFSIQQSSIRSLADEILASERYIEVLSEGEGHPIACVHNLDARLASSIIVPANFLLDVYINAMNRGELIKMKDGKILTTLGVEAGSATYSLAVEDNGIGYEQGMRNRSPEHTSTGLARMQRKIEIFNLLQEDFKILFDMSSDISTIPGDVGQALGTRVSFKIIKR